MTQRHVGTGLLFVAIILASWALLYMLGSVLGASLLTPPVDVGYLVAISVVTVSLGVGILLVGPRSESRSGSSSESDMPKRALPKVGILGQILIFGLYMGVGALQAIIALVLAVSPGPDQGREVIPILFVCGVASMALGYGLYRLSRIALYGLYGLSAMVVIVAIFRLGMGPEAAISGLIGSTLSILASIYFSRRSTLFV